MYELSNCLSQEGGEYLVLIVARFKEVVMELKPIKLTMNSMDRNCDK